MSVYEEEFRDHLNNVNNSGKRVWLYPKIIIGKFYKLRRKFSWLLLAFLMITPWLHINGHPVFLFNILERKFILFGIPFWPQDFYLVALGLLTFIVFIVAFTAVFGRVFCGWACPQTIFMEMIFRRIETLIEGSPAQQKKLKAMPWNSEKIRKRFTKHFVFWIISFIISNTFLAYIIGREEMIKIVTEPINKHIGGFFGIVIFTSVFYLVFAKMRELVCVMICPYGRLQGVLLDPQSIVVAYDYKRGEPRGKLQKNKTEEKRGDCVDCDLCVDVCPTGIDIRHGTQMECVHCTACIDACDSVMEKIHKPKGLVRYASKEGLENNTKFKFTNRIKAYTIFWLILFTVFCTLVILRKEVQVSVFRAKGSLYSKAENGDITNLYDIKLVNKTFHPMVVKVSSNKEHLSLQTLTDNLEVMPGEVKTVPMMVRMKQKDIKDNTIPFELQVYSKDKLLNSVKETFLAPVYD